MTLSERISQQLDKPSTGLALLGELEFSTGTLRYTTWSLLKGLMGHDWLGLPAGMVSVSAVRESERIEYPAVDLGLPVANAQMLNAAMGEESTYRGRLARLWLVVFDDVGQIQDEPSLVWVGLMDQMTLVTGDGQDENGSLNLRCEQPGKDARNPQSIRLSNAQQQYRHPGDTGLSRMAALAATKDQVWLSRKFQEV